MAGCCDARTSLETQTNNRSLDRRSSLPVYLTLLQMIMQESSTNAEQTFFHPIFYTSSHFNAGKYKNKISQINHH